MIASLGQFQGWQNMAQLTMPALVLYGYQDLNWITQAYILREVMPQLQIQWLNECGHWPWLEQPEQFYPRSKRFCAARMFLTIRTAASELGQHQLHLALELCLLINEMGHMSIYHL